ncbi:MAG: hypothetical protein KA369_00740 [Spirochaetes bacterium]|nr:hypothetical protein [Spirochaetota bacterium]
MTIVKYTLLWIPLVFIAICNGAIRDVTYKNSLGDLGAHQLSTLTGLILFGIYIWAIGLKWRLESARQAVAVGCIWLALTVAFEFLFFHYVAGHPWSVLLDAYNILEGKVWVLVLIFVAVAPYLSFRIHSKRNN